MKLELILSLFVLIVFISGCGGDTVYSNEPTNGDNEVRAVTTLGDIFVTAENFDSDAEIDGLTFYLSPKDKDGMVVETDGTLNVKLWQHDCETFSYGTCTKDVCIKSDSFKIEEWNNLLITKENIGFMGAEVKLEYENYQLTGKDIFDAESYKLKGCVEVTFITQGKTFSAAKDNIFLEGF